MLKVTDIETKDIKYDLSKWAKYEAKLKPLLPTKTREIISFVIRNTDTPTANGLRRTLIEELPVKILHIDVEDIETDEVFLIRDELIDRIHSIPIDQSVKDDETFSLDIANTDTTKRIGHVYSGDIKGLDDKADKRFRIAELHPGKHLQVANIRVLTGYGYMHSNFMLTCGIGYKPLDYIDVTRVDERGFLQRGMALTSDVLKALGGAKLNETTVHNERILFIPNADCKKNMSEAGRNRLSQYTVVNSDIKFHSSSITHPTVYMLNVETLGTVKANNLIKMACNNLVARLQKIHDGLVIYSKNPDADPTDIDIIANVTSKLTKVEIKGETHTIGEILVYNVQKLDPTVANVSKHIIHPMDRRVVINIIHAEPIKIIMDACKLGIDNYNTIAKAF